MTVKELGFGFLALKPCEFWELTPLELSQLASGAVSRWWDRREEYAQWAAFIVAPHCKRPPRASSLVKRPTKDGVKGLANDREWLAEVRRLKEKVEKHGA